MILKKQINQINLISMDRPEENVPGQNGFLSCAPESQRFLKEKKNMSIKSTKEKIWHL